MLCILIFIIFLIFFPILGVFPQYRAFFAKSWSCVWKKVRLKPCDIDLGQELKNKTTSWLFFHSPKLARFVDKTFSFWAFLFVAVNVFSLLYTINAGINLFVYDTCSPTSTEGCALSGDSCEIGVDTISFNQARRTNKLGQWAAQPFNQFGETISLIPNRLKNWDADEYILDNSSFYTYNPENPNAVEIIDPGCPSCKRLWSNIKDSTFPDNYNLAYLLYPIPSNSTESGYRFNNSKLISSYVLAANELEDTSVENGDWQLLDYIFTARADKYDVQFQLADLLEPNSDEAIDLIHQGLSQAGYSEAEISVLDELSQSQAIQDQLELSKKVVEEDIQTIKIPTIIFNGRRHSRVLEVEDLN